MPPLFPLFLEVVSISNGFRAHRTAPSGSSAHCCVCPTLSYPSPASEPLTFCLCRSGCPPLPRGRSALAVTPAPCSTPTPWKQGVGWSSATLSTRGPRAEATQTHWPDLCEEKRLHGLVTACHPVPGTFVFCRGCPCPDEGLIPAKRRLPKKTVSPLINRRAS